MRKDGFEPERGLRFSTYASMWIRQSILRGLAEQSRSVRIPVQMFRQMNRFHVVERDLRARLGREPQLEEIAAVLEITVARAERLRSLVAGMRSLDESEGVDAFEQLSAESLGTAPTSVERMVELQLEHEKIDRLQAVERLGYTESCFFTPFRLLVDSEAVYNDDEFFVAAALCCLSKNR